MVDWMSIALIEGVIIVIFIFLVIVCIKVNINNAKKRKILVDTERLKHEGTQIRAKVTDVLIQKEQKKYIVVAEGYGPEKKTLYHFRKTFPFPKGATSKFRPNVKKGRFVSLRVAFNPLISHMENDW